MQALQAEGCGKRKLYYEKKKRKKCRLVITKLTFLEGMAGVSQAVYLTSADQVIPDGQV